MEIKYILDTNFVIHYLVRREDCVDLFEKIISINPNIFISVISIAELYSSPKLSEADFKLIDNFIQDLNIVYADLAIAKLCGEVRRKSKIKTPDALIAATSLLYDFTLVTENYKDFNNIEGLKILKF